MVTFKQAYDAAVERNSEIWPSLTPSQLTEAVYREMRRLDAEAVAAERPAYHADAPAASAGWAAPSRRVANSYAPLPPREETIDRGQRWHSSTLQRLGSCD